MSVEEAVRDLVQEQFRAANKRLAEQELNEGRAKMNRILKTAYFNENQNVQGKTHWGTRHVADIPYDVYMRMCELYGPDYWHDLRNIKRHKQFHVIERI